MYRHPFRKSFGLIVLYSIIIIGIFVLQFRNESAFSKNIGLLSVSLAQSQSESGEITLKNSLQASFKGISFTAEEVSPARLVKNGQSKEDGENLVLLSYEQPTPLSFVFNFTNDVSLTFAVSGTDSGANLSITANIPNSAEGLYLNYKPSSGFSVTEKTSTKLILNSKNLTYAFIAPKIDDKSIYFSAKNFVSYYVAYNPAVEFSFDSLDPDLVITQKSTFDANIRNFRANIVASVSEAIKNNQNLSEKSVIAYVAELASQGRYTEAVNNVPDSFKKGNKRTYLSSVYFNTLEAMYPSLEMHRENMAEILNNAINSPNLSVFSVEGLAEYIDSLTDTSKIRPFLEQVESLLDAAQDSSQVKVSQASGILNTYFHLSTLHSSLADSLLPAAKKCLPIIESKCVMRDSLLYLNEKDTPVSNFLAISTGMALVRWGELNNDANCARAGHTLINSILSISTLDTITQADVYPVLVDNVFYPHYKALSRTSNRVIWAWTCAPSVTYSEQLNIATLVVGFQSGESNYLIVNGIRDFTGIEIYGLSYHSDPRFEIYNSSGFVYKENRSVLLLKSRHRSNTEVVRLTYE